MATERDMNDYGAGFEDERAATPGDEVFDLPPEGGEGAAAAGGGDTGGMNLDAAAAEDKPAGGMPSDHDGDEGGQRGPDGVLIVATATPTPDANAASSAASTGGNPDQKPIERQPEGGQGSAADNGSGGNGSGDESGAADVSVVLGAASPEDSPAGEAPDLSEPSSDADKQRARSWEGRLRAQEERLKARSEELDQLAKELEAKGAGAGQQPGEATGDALEQVAERTNDPAMVEAAEEMSQRVESGEISPQDAIAQLKEDFGEPFVNMIQSIAKAAVGSELQGIRGDIDKVRTDTDQVISHLNDASDRRHFEEIVAVYPDFNEIGKSPEFAQFIDGLPPEEKADAERVKQNGSAKEVIALLDKFEAGKKGGPSNESEATQVAANTPATGATGAPATPPTAGPSDSEIDAAAGVRGGGGGMQLPQEPGSGNSDDYASAWDDAPDVRGRA